MRRRAGPSQQFEQTLLGISDQLDELHARINATEVEAVDEEAQFQLVVVCTGNRFRSPLAAAVVEQLVAELPVQVSSLGTLDLGGAPPLRAAVKQAGRMGLDLSSHRARTIVGADLREADLIVGFERAHLGAAVLEARAPRERSFLITELVELLELSPPVFDADPLHRARAAVDVCGRNSPREPGRVVRGDPRSPRRVVEARPRGRDGRAASDDRPAPRTVRLRGGGAGRPAAASAQVAVLTAVEPDSAVMDVVARTPQRP